MSPPGNNHTDKTHENIDIMFNSSLLIKIVHLFICKNKLRTL